MYWAVLFLVFLVLITFIRKNKQKISNSGRPAYQPPSQPASKQAIGVGGHGTAALCIIRAAGIKNLGWRKPILVGIGTMYLLKFGGD